MANVLDYSSPALSKRQHRLQLERTILTWGFAVMGGVAAVVAWQLESHGSNTMWYMWFWKRYVAMRIAAQLGLAMSICGSFYGVRAVLPRTRWRVFAGFAIAANLIGLVWFLLFEPRLN